MTKRWIVFSMLLLSAVPSFSDVIHREKSLYRNIEVQETGRDRCLVFAQRSDDRRQSCVNLKNPDRVVFSYVRMTFAGLLLNERPGSILIVGLGGGTLPSALGALYPEASIDVIEIDPAVVRVAESFFDFQVSDRVKVWVQDARVFIKRAGRRGDQYDLIILDAFTGEYIPEHLMTREFLQETQSLLSNTGVLVANTFSSSELYDYESVTYRDVFGKFFNFKLPASGNRVVIASSKPLPDSRALQAAASRLSVPLSRFGVAIESFPRFLTTRSDWDEDAPVLTDQFSPANLLKNR
ncbi:MAG: spermidine synthase [Pseudomonadales bacterium]